MFPTITHTAAANGPKSVDGLEGIATAVAGATAELDVEPLLDRLLPRLARAIGAAALTVQLGGKAREHTVTGADKSAGAIESRRPLVVAGRILGVLWAWYPAGASPAPSAETLLDLVTCQLAFALDVARVAGCERRWRRALELEARRKDDFMAVLAHELRAPLTAIRIGLAVAKRLVELHGGAIEAHSAGRGRGSEFVVRLPLIADRLRAAA